MAQKTQYGNAYNADDNYDAPDSGGVGAPPPNPMEQQAQQNNLSPDMVEQKALVVGDDPIPPPAPQEPDTCSKLVNWFPMKWLALLGGLGLIVTSLLDLIFGGKNNDFVNTIVFCYLIIFGMIVVFTEASTFKLTRKCQLGIFFWFRLFSRTWGRAIFYIFLAFLSYSQIGGTHFYACVIAGIYLNLMAIIMFLFSGFAAAKYNHIYNYMTDGSVDEEAEAKIMRVFDELDTDHDGQIGAVELSKLADQSGKHLSNGERQTIQCFIDESCNGFLSKEDWMKQWLTFNPYNQKLRFI